MKRQTLINDESNRRPLALGLTLMGALLRLIPHLPNMSPVGGFSLFAGARLRGWQAYSIPLIIIVVTDPIMGRIFGYPSYTIVTPFVCGSFLVNVWIGSHLRRTENPWRIGGAALLGSVHFFLISNFGLWVSGISVFPLTLSGLMACYLAGLPYFGRSMTSDVAYAGLLFGLHAWLTRAVLPQERVGGTTQVPLS